MSDFVAIDCKSYVKSCQLSKNDILVKILPKCDEVRNIIKYIDNRIINKNIAQDIKQHNDYNIFKNKNEILCFIKYLLWRYDMSPHDLLI